MEKSANIALKRAQNDAIILRSGFMTGLIAKIISKIIEKQGYSAKVSLHEVTMTHADDDGNVHVHLDLYLDASEKDIRKLLNML